MSALLRTERITPIFASTFIQPIPQGDRSLRIRPPTIERQQPAKSLLQKEVEKVKKAPEKEGIPWYYLSGTGFFVKEQVSQIVKSVKEAKKLGKSVDEAIAMEMQKVAVDIQAFEQEYLKQLLLLPIVLKKKDINGTDRIVAPNYGDKMWEDTLNKSERNGAVHDALFVGNKELGIPSIEEFLLTGEPGSMAIMVSPAGWSGLYDSRGNKIIYSERQIYAWQIQQDGTPKGFSFRDNPSFEQNISLMQQLGLDTQNAANTEEGLMAMVKNVAFFNPGNGKMENFSDLVNLLETVKGSSEAYLGKSYDEIRHHLQSPDSLWDLDERTPLLTAEFQKLAVPLLHNITDETEKTLQIALAITVLQITNNYTMDAHITNDGAIIRNYSTGRRSQQLHIGHPLYLPFNYETKASELKQLPGCAGGGVNAKEADVTAGGLRMGGITRISSINSRAGKTEQGFECPSCHAGWVVGNECPTCSITAQEWGEQNPDLACV